jgi:hypothetical protein
MSLNVENLFVRCPDQGRVAEETMRQMGASNAEDLGSDWSLPSSYDVIQSKRGTRKIALSPPAGQWIGIVESTEAVDFGLAKRLSESLATTVVVIQLYETSGDCGYLACSRGKIIESVFDKDSEDPAGRITQTLEKYQIPFTPILFREAVTRTAQGWLVKSAKQRT